MEDNHINIKHGANARLEHINVPVGEGYTRWHCIDRGSQADSLGVGDNPDHGSALHPAQSRLHQALDLCKRKLLFWR